MCGVSAAGRSSGLRGSQHGGRRRGAVKRNEQEPSAVCERRLSGPHLVGAEQWQGHQPGPCVSCGMGRAAGSIEAPSLADALVCSFLQGSVIDCPSLSQAKLWELHQEQSSFCANPLVLWHAKQGAGFGSSASGKSILPRSGVGVLL